MIYCLSYDMPHTVTKHEVEVTTNHTGAILCAMWLENIPDEIGCIDSEVHTENIKNLLMDAGKVQTLPLVWNVPFLSSRICIPQQVSRPRYVCGLP